MLKRTPLRRRPVAEHREEPGWREWKAPVHGRCRACGAHTLCLRHHVVLEQHVRMLGGDPYDLRNSLLIGAGHRCTCHRDHHAAVRRLPRSLIPAAAREFAVEMLGAAGAEAYLERYYS